MSTESNTPLEERLRLLPAISPISDGWPALVHEMRARRSRRRKARIALAAAASLIASMSALLALPSGRSGRDPTSVTSGDANARSVAALMARSRALEFHLAQARAKVTVWDDQSAARAAVLEGELSLVDLQLPYAQPHSAQRLWRDRVDLLSSLVRTHQDAGLVNATYTTGIEDRL